MTKTELLEQILAELQSMRRLLELVANVDENGVIHGVTPPTPTGTTERQAMENGTHPLSGRVYNPLSDTWDFPPRKPNGDKAGQY